MEKSTKSKQITEQALANFLSLLPIKVTTESEELVVLSVYLDDDGVICIDVCTAD